MIELITVMIVVGIISVVALPRLTSLSDISAAGYRDEVKATLEYARKSAVAQRRYVQVVLSNNGLSLKIDNDVPTGANSQTYPRALTLPAPDSKYCGSGVTNQICAPSAMTLTGPATLVFSSSGSVTAASNVYTITGGSSSYTATVDTTTGYVY